VKRMQTGAALLLLIVVLVTTAAIVGTVTLRRMASTQAVQNRQARELALASEALIGVAFRQHCQNTATPMANLLPCPDMGAAEGNAAAACPGLTQGWLPWRTLSLPPQRDSSGTCLWYERQGTTGRVIAAGSATPAQIRNNLGSRPVCGGNNTAANYIDATDVALTVTLNVAQLTARCP
jgi:hypothetical protein